MPNQTAASPTEPPEDRASPTFSARLREDTKRIHREAERTGFLAELIRGRATTAGYALFLRSLVPVYEALETALDGAERNVLVEAFARPALRRLPGLLSDLAALAGTAPPVPADEALAEARAYAAAITRAAAAGAPRLVAHAYARYLGDLSGGQILKPILARSLGLTPDMLRFYDFVLIDDPDAAKASMRQALDTIPPQGPAADAIVAEAIDAFRHNINLSCAVARRLSPAV